MSAEYLLSTFVINSVLLILFTAKSTDFCFRSLILFSDNAIDFLSTSNFWATNFSFGSFDTIPCIVTSTSFIFSITAFSSSIKAANFSSCVTELLFILLIVEIWSGLISFAIFLISSCFCLIASSCASFVLTTIWSALSSTLCLTITFKLSNCAFLSNCSGVNPLTILGSTADKAVSILANNKLSSFWLAFSLSTSDNLEFVLAVLIFFE